MTDTGPAPLTFRRLGDEWGVAAVDVCLSLSSVEDIRLVARPGGGAWVAYKPTRPPNALSAEDAPDDGKTPGDAGVDAEDMADELEERRRGGGREPGTALAAAARPDGPDWAETAQGPSIHQRLAAIEALLRDVESDPQDPPADSEDGLTPAEVAERARMVLRDAGDDAGTAPGAAEGSDTEPSGRGADER